MLDAVHCRLVARPAAALPVARLVLGKPVEEVAALLPRLFNLCRGAQSTALRAALGLPAERGAEPIAVEVARDHLMRFCVLWPRHFGRPSTPLPSTWRQADAAVRQTLFGATGRLPGRPADFDAFLAARTGIAGPLHDIAGAFRANEAVADALEPVSPETAFSPKAAVENSIAARHATHPVMVDLAARFGRGPLW
ncbi:MAG: hydrogenase expression/formation protein HupK, partial [Pseudomonadota bacterium]